MWRWTKFNYSLYKIHLANISRYSTSPETANRTGKHTQWLMVSDSNPWREEPNYRFYSQPRFLFCDGFFSFTYLKKEKTSAEQIFQIMSVSCLCSSIEAKAEKLSQKHNCQSLWFTYSGVNSNEQSKEEKEKRTRKIVLLSRALFVVNCHLAVAFSPKCNTTHNWNVVLLGHVGTLLLFKCLIGTKFRSVALTEMLLLITNTLPTDSSNGASH